MSDAPDNADFDDPATGREGQPGIGRRREGTPGILEHRRVCADATPKARSSRSRLAMKAHTLAAPVAILSTLLTLAGCAGEAPAPSSDSADVITKAPSAEACEDAIGG